MGVLVLGLHALLGLALLNAIVRQPSRHESPRVSVRLLPAPARIAAHTRPDVAAARPQAAASVRAPARPRSLEQTIGPAEPSMPTDAEPVAAAAAASAAPPLDADLLDNPASRRAIRNAARDPHLAGRVNEQFGVRSASRDERLIAAAQRAARPDCLRADALKNDPPEIAGIGLGGLLALPFLPHAALTGKCALP